MTSAPGPVEHVPLYASLEADPDAVVVLDARGRVTHANPTFAVLAPHARAGLDAARLLRDEAGRDLARLVDAAIAADRPQRSTLLAPLPDGLRRLDVSATPVRVGGAMVAVVVRAHDVTDEAALVEAARHDAELERGISAVTRAATSGGGALRVLDAAAEAVASLVPGSTGLVLQRRAGRLVLRARAGSPLGMQVGDERPLELAPVVARVLRERRARLWVVPPELRIDPSYEVAAAAPVRHRGRTWGAVAANAPAAVAPPEAVLGALARLADVLGLALDADTDRRRLSRFADSDALTGVLNVRAFHGRLADEVSRTQRTGAPLTLALIDLDRFKLVNDAHGHDAGDRALRAFAAILRRVARRSDVVARLGGDEFAWLMPDARESEAAAAAARLRARVGESDAFAGVAVTASIGLASLGPAESDGDLLAHADQALYGAKRGGRDRSTWAGARTL